MARTSQMGVLHLLTTRLNWTGIGLGGRVGGAEMICTAMLALANYCATWVGTDEIHSRESELIIP